MSEDKDTMESRINAAMDAVDFPDPPDTEEEGSEETVETEETTTEDVVDEVEDTEEDTESVEDAGDDAEYHSALAAMLRDGLPQGAIDALDRDQVLEYGAKRAKVQRDTDTAFGAAGNATNVDRTSREAQEPGPAEAPDDPAKAVAESLKPALEGLGLDADSDEAASLTKAILAANEAQLGPLRQELESYRAQAVQGQVQEMRNRLVDKFPELKQEATWEQVRAAASGLAQSGTYATEADEAKRAELLLEAGYRALHPDAPSRQELERQQRQRRNRRAGQPTARATKSPPKELTKAQKMAKAVEMAESGKSSDEITREIGSIF